MATQPTESVLSTTENSLHHRGRARLWLNLGSKTGIPTSELRAYLIFLGLILPSEMKASRETRMNSLIWNMQNTSTYTTIAIIYVHQKNYVNSTQIFKEIKKNVVVVKIWYKMVKKIVEKGF